MTVSSRCGWGFFRYSSVRRSAVARNRPGDRRGQPSFGRGGGHRDLPPAVHLADDVVVRHEGVVEEDLGEGGVLDQVVDRSDRDSGLIEADHHVRQAAMALAVGVGPEQAVGALAERTPGGPGLLPGDPPAAVDLAGRRSDVRQIGTGFGLAPGLGPQELGRGHRSQDPILLLVGPELEQGGGQQEDPVLGHPRRGAGRVVLLLEDQPLHQGGFTTAVRFRPADDGPSGVE